MSFQYPLSLEKVISFLRDRTVSDYAKRGPNADPMMIGMTDPKGKLKDQPVCILKPDDME